MMLVKLSVPGRSTDLHDSRAGPVRAVGAGGCYLYIFSIDCLFSLLTPCLGGGPI